MTALVRYWYNDGSGVYHAATLDEARQRAAEALDVAHSEARYDGEWPSGVDEIAWGVGDADGLHEDLVTLGRVEEYDRQDCVCEDHGSHDECDEECDCGVPMNVSFVCSYRLREVTP